MNIEKLLKQKGLSKKEFADKMGIANQNVNKLLTNPTEKNIRKIAEVLGVPVSALFADSASVQDGCSDFVAMIRRNGNVYCVDSVQELKRVADEWSAE